MLRPHLSRIVMALLLSGASSASALAWWDRCNCQAAPLDPIPPAYVYDHGMGPSWGANGCSYPPVTIYYPVTIAPLPYAAPYRVDYPLAPPRAAVRGGWQPLK